ncbi:MAG: sulfatase [Planctomycetota bacterium]|jgi:arylsulfatase A-like enzyme
MAKNRKLTRRKVVGLGLSGAAAAAAGGNFAVNILNRPRPRNVVFIVSDALRADRLGCYGPRRDVEGTGASLTPNIDRIASEGVLFERCLSTSSWTLPSVASYMTSRPPFVAGDRYNEGYAPRECRTCAEILEGRGWATVAVIHNPYLFVRSETGERELLVSRGFQRYITGQLRRGENPLHAQGIGREEIFSGFSNAATAVKRADRVLREFARSRRPFFLYIHLMDTHEPYDPPEDYKGVCTVPALEGVPDYVLYHLIRVSAAKRGAQTLAEEDMPYFQRAREVYNAAAHFVDEWVGRLTNYLKSIGLWKSTLFVFSSDHGEEFGEHGWLGHSTTLYDESLLVPLVMAGRGVEPGARVARSVSLLDVVPTILTSCDVAVPQTMFGEALPLDGGPEGVPRSAVATLVKPDGPGPLVQKKYAVADPRGLKYVRTDFIGEEAGTPSREELYDLRSDPGEKTDTAAEDPGSVEILRGKLDRLRERAVSREGKAFTVNDEAREILKSLGYLQ